LRARCEKDEEMSREDKDYEEIECHDRGRNLEDDDYVEKEGGSG